MMNNRTRLACGIGTIVGLSVIPSAHAQPTAELTDAGRQVIQEAAQAAQRKDWAVCKTKAAGVWDSVKNAKVAGLLGSCEVELGLYRDAAEHLRFYLTHDDKADADRTKGVEEALGRAKQKVGSLSVECSATDASLKIDGRAVGAAPINIFVEPGTRSIEATKDGFVTKVETIEVPAGSEKSVTIVLVERDTSVRPPIASRPAWPAVTLGIVGAAGLGAGLGLVVGAHGQLSDVKGTRCSGGETTCPTKVSDAVQSHNRLEAGSIPAFVVGGAALVGMVTYLAWPKGHAPKTEAGWTIAPIASREKQGLFLMGEF